MKYFKWALVETFFPPKLFQQVFVLIISFFFSWMLKLISQPGNLWIPVCACVWKHSNGSVTLSLHTTCGRLMRQSVALPILRVLLVNWWSYFASDVKPDGCFHFITFFALSVSFIPFQKIVITENWNADIEQKGEKAVTFTSCLLCSDVLGRKKR